MSLGTSGAFAIRDNVSNPRPKRSSNDNRERSGRLTTASHSGESENLSNNKRLISSRVPIQGVVSVGLKEPTSLVIIIQTQKLTDSTNTFDHFGVASGARRHFP